MNIPKRRKRESMGVKEPNVIRVPSFLAFVRRHVCAATQPFPTAEDVKIGNVCSGSIEAAHVRTGTDGGIGMKPSDKFALPLCSNHHWRQHQIGEAAFQKETGLDMREYADKIWAFWLKTVTGAKWKREHPEHG